MPFTCVGVLLSQYIYFIAHTAMGAHAAMDTLGPWYNNSGKSQYCTGLQLVDLAYILVDCISYKTHGLQLVDLAYILVDCISYKTHGLQLVDLVYILVEYSIQDTCILRISKHLCKFVYDEGCC